ncbi:amidohydrolase family protein [Maribacter sp. X9]|uniref:amidohydrolase family protein n=1 Tax=Maribacter sp. X9 TaxID=3402159 RepID=UPI003AF3BCC3
MSIPSHFKRYSFVLFILLSIFSCKEKPAILYDVVISNVNLINVETGEINNLNIYLKEGRIALLQPNAANPASKSKQIIDAKGTYALPGFWDNHVHFRGGDSLAAANKNFLKLFLANGITTVRDAGGDLTPDVLKWKSAIHDGKLDGPTIFTSGPKIDGPGATWAGSLEVENEMDIEQALDSLQQIPVDFVKLYDSKISGENYVKTIQAAAKRGMITSGHMPFTVTLNETIDAGINGVEHLYYIMKGASADEISITEQLKTKELGFWGAMPLLQQSYSDSVAQTLFQKLKANDVFVIPTLHIRHTLSYLDEVDHSKDDYINYISDGIQKTYQGRIDRVKFADAKTVADRKALDQFFVKLAKSLNEAGVFLLAGSDSGAFNSYTYPGISLHKEMEAMVAAGISPLEALQTSAYNGSRFLKKDSDYGTVAVGKKADLVLLNSNPLEHIQNTQDIFMVIKEGEIYTKQTLDSLLNSAIIKN